MSKTSENPYIKKRQSHKTPILKKRLSQKPLVTDVMSQVSAAWKETDKLGSSVNYDAESIASTGTYLQGSKGIRQTADRFMYITKCTKLPLL